MFNLATHGVWPYRQSTQNALHRNLWEGLQAAYAPLMGPCVDSVYTEITGREGTPTVAEGTPTIDYDSVFLDNNSSSAHGLELPPEWIVPNVTGTMAIVLDCTIYNGGASDGRILTKQSTWATEDNEWMLSDQDDNQLRIRLKAGGTTETFLTATGVYEYGERMLVALCYDDPSVLFYVLNRSGLDVSVSTHSVGGDVTQTSGDSFFVRWGLGTEGSEGSLGSPMNCRIYATYFYNRILDVGELYQLQRLELFETLPFSLAQSAGGTTHEEATTLTLSGLLVPVAQADFESINTLTANGILTLAADANFETAATLSASALAAFVSDAAFQSALLATQNAVAAFSSDITVEAGVALTQAGAISLLANAAFESATTLTQDATGTPTANLDAQSALTLSAAIASAFAGEIIGAGIIEAALTLSSGQTIVPTNIATFEAAASIDAVANAALTAGRVTGVALALTHDSGVTFASDTSIEGALSLSLSAFVQSTKTTDAGASITLDITQAIVPTNTTDFEAQVSITSDYALQLVAGAITEAGLSLSAAHVISATASHIVFGIVTPDGRTYTIELDNRTLNSASDDRTHRVN